MFEYIKWIIYGDFLSNKHKKKINDESELFRQVKHFHIEYEFINHNHNHNHNHDENQKKIPNENHDENQEKIPNDISNPNPNPNLNEISHENPNPNDIPNDIPNENSNDISNDISNPNDIQNDIPIKIVKLSDQNQINGYIMNTIIQMQNNLIIQANKIEKITKRCNNLDKLLYTLLVSIGLCWGTLKLVNFFRK